MKALYLERQKKTFKIPHTEPGVMHLDYVLVPIGYSYNAELAKAKKGDTLRLFDGGEYPIVAVRKLKLAKAETDLLCRMRYGISIKGALTRWKMNAKMEGHGERAISYEECLWIVYDNQ